MDVLTSEKRISVRTRVQTWGDLVDWPETRKPTAGPHASRVLDDLSIHVQSAAASAKEVIRLFEHGDEHQAYTQLVELLDSVRILFTVFSQDLGWVETPEAEIPREEFASILQRALTQLIKAKESHFWISICDVLEFEIEPLLESWQKIVERTHAQAN